MDGAEKMLFLNTSIFLLPLCLQQCQSHLISQILYITFCHRSQTWFPRSIRFRKDARIFFFLLNFYAEHKGGHLNSNDTFFFLTKFPFLISAIIPSSSYFHFLENVLLALLNHLIRIEEFNLPAWLPCETT